MDTNRFETNSRTRLAEAMRKEVTKMMEKSLDFAHVACHKDNFQQLRSKILRVGNDCMRNLEKELNSYKMSYTHVGEEIIEFKNVNKG